MIRRGARRGRDVEAEQLLATTDEATFRDRS
jgi:hypothetical protein